MQTQLTKVSRDQREPLGITRFDIKILHIGWVDRFKSEPNGPQKYTIELLKRLSSTFISYYERVSGIKLYLRASLLIPKYYNKDIDIIHILGQGPHCLIGILLSKLLGKPIVMTLFAYHRDELHATHESLILNLIPVILERITMNFANVVVVMSRWQMNRLPKAIRRKTIVVYPGGDESNHDRDPSNNFNNAVCITGSLSSNYHKMRKGLDVIAEIADITPQLTFHIVGGFLYQIKNIIIKTPTNMVFHGYLSEKQLQKLLSESKFIIAPSRHESFSISVLEGMNNGCIGIVSVYCGIQDIIDRCGLILPLRADVFSRSMIDLLEKAEEADKMRIGAMLIARNYTWQRTADSYIDIFRTVKAQKA